MKFNPTTGKLETSSPPGGGSGDVVGPASATDKAIARYDLATGKLIQDSGITIADGTTGSLANTNTGDQLMFGTIAVAAQPDVDPVGTGDTLTLVAGTNVTITTNNTTKEVTFNASSGTDSFGITVDGAGTALTTGSKGYKQIPFDCTVTGWVVTSKETGSIVFDIKRSTYAGFPTTSTIAGTEKPTLSAAQKNEDLTLSTWTTSLSAGDIVEFVVDSASTVTRATVTILVSKI